MDELCNILTIWHLSKCISFPGKETNDLTLEFKSPVNIYLNILLILNCSAVISGNSFQYSKRESLTQKVKRFIPSLPLDSTCLGRFFIG